jgi:hypothetical protein
MPPDGAEALIQSWERRLLRTLTDHARYCCRYI